MDLDWTASFSIRFRNGTCIIILDNKYNIANCSCYFGSYGSIWTGPSPKKYYMDLRSSEASVHIIFFWWRTGPYYILIDWVWGNRKFVVPETLTIDRGEVNSPGRGDNKLAIPEYTVYKYFIIPKNIRLIVEWSPQNDKDQ